MIDNIILGCTELPLFLDDAFPMNIVNPNQLLAEAAVKYALET